MYELLGVFAFWAVAWLFRWASSTESVEQVPETFTLRLRRERLKGSGHVVIAVEARGLFPLRETVLGTFVTSVLDVTDSDDPKPVLCSLDNFQEQDSIVFQQATKPGELSAGYGFLDWVEVGAAFPEVLQPPFGGVRKLAVVVRLIDVRNPPPITHGFSDSKHPGLLWTGVENMSWTFDEKGYEEVTAHRYESRALGIKAAVAVAMVDQSLDRAEGELLQRWVARQIEPFEGARREELRVMYNKAMREAFEEARQGRLSLSEVTRRLHEIAEPHTKYDIMELCHDVMAADGVAADDELRLLGQIAAALELDLDQVNAMRDKRILSVGTGVPTEGSPDALLGIQSGWGKDEIKRHLRTEFGKWNNRLNTLTDPDDRANAQRMLDLISDARKRHG